MYIGMNVLPKIVTSTRKVLHVILLENSPLPRHKITPI